MQKTHAKILLSTVFHMQYIRRKDFTQIYRVLYGDPMLVPIRMGTDMADGNQQKQPSLSFARKACIHFWRNSKQLI